MTPTPDVMSRAALIFLSYRFSQGAVGAQNRLLLLLEERWAPALFDRDGLPAVRRAVRRIVGNYFLDDRLHPAAALPWTNGATGAAAKSEAVVTNELAGLFRRFEHREELAPFSSDPVALAASLIFMDDGYLQRPRGRDTGDTHLRVARRAATPDPWHSVFAAYALLGRPTGRGEYDSLFGLLRDNRVLAGLGPSDRRALRRVVDRFSHHSDLKPDERTRLEDAVRVRV
jgi:hypothetical protein